MSFMVMRMVRVLHGGQCGARSLARLLGLVEQVGRVAASRIKGGLCEA